MRSATDSLAMPRMKREASEMSVSMFDLPPAKRITRAPSVQLRHLQARQINLNDLTVATEKKVKQKARIEEELRGAINNLKKPNRGAAIKEYVDETEQRSLGSTSMRKKTAGPVRKFQPANSVQVTATPRHVRKTDALAPTTANKSRINHDDEMQPPSSGNSCIPSSAVQPSRNGRIAFNQPQFTRKPADVGNSVAETPSRGRSKTVTFPDFDKRVPSSSFSSSQPAAVHLEAAATAQTPIRSSAKPLHFPSIRSQQISDDTILQTPSKPRDVEKKNIFAFATPQRPASGGTPAPVPQTPDPPQNTTIPKSVDVDDEKAFYDALGWNDYDDLA
jgi:DNA replication regulator SLD3